MNIVSFGGGTNSAASVCRKSSWRHGFFVYKSGEKWYNGEGDERC